MTDKYTLTFKNKRIFDFYQKNASVDIEAMNLIFVDLFEKLFQDMDSVMNSTINSQILSNVGELKTQVNNIHNNVSQLNTDLSNTMSLKIHDSKREYIEDIKNIFTNNFSLNNEKINDLLTTSTSNLIDKTSLLIQDIVPKSQEQYYKLLQENLSVFQKSITEDTIKLMNSVNKETSFQQFINNFENKSSTMIQPLYTFITSSEERLTTNITSLKDSSIQQLGIQDKLFHELTDFLNKYKGSSYKGQFGENQLETVLTTMYPSAEIINTTGIKASGDFQVKRNNKDSFLIETKNYDRNVNNDEIKKFYRDVEEQNFHGIFLSQHSGITSKQNFQIEIKGNKIVVFVHNVNYCPNTIKIAIDIIDNLSDKISEFNIIEDENIISKDQLDEINKEYKNFIQHKLTIIECSKEFQKKLLTEIESIQFPSLSKYLTNKFTDSTYDNKNIVCDICNVYNANNNKALAAHKRGCKKKHSIKNDPDIVINTNS